MMITITLEFNHGFQWFEKNGIYVKGYVFDENNNLYQNGQLTDYFLGCENEQDFKRKLEHANGIFCVIIKRDDKAFIGVDRTRTFPIFYTEKENDFYISDNTYFFKNKLHLKQIDRLSQEEFLLTGYVTGENTLLKNVYQLQAGQYATAGKGLNKDYYFTYAARNAVNKTYDTLEKELLHAFEDVFGRLITSVDNRTIVIPLSGGYDSRLIAVMLKKLGYENVICFTYGRYDSFEVEISTKVAEKLGYKHINVEYHDNLFDGFVDDERYIRYSKFGANHTSVFLLQDYFAVKYIYDKELIPKDSVIVPGHTVFISGAHIPAGLKKKRMKSRIINEIMRRHYSLKKIIDAEKFRVKISQQLGEGFSYSCFENWVLKERAAKFIVNADRTYEIFGYEHRIPLWDNALIEFFKYLDIKYKLNKKFYNNVLEKTIFSRYGVDFGEKNKGNELIQRIKMFIKPYVPKYIFDKYKTKKDINCFYPVSKRLLDSMTNPDGIDIWNDNSVVAYWYVESLQ
ncbi:MAG TPA: asparagine synthetase B family protein, partial [bacterium]|nr:asparagine synthetase B family protein [bacterium]